ncbi:hypothetical protein KM043_004108 [Ampulex compressa]|nr:hypothetical protein KM043_004108 [Ampulex compressa]
MSLYRPVLGFLVLPHWKKEPTWKLEEGGSARISVADSSFVGSKLWGRSENIEEARRGDFRNPIGAKIKERYTGTITDEERYGVQLHLCAGHQKRGRPRNLENDLGRGTDAEIATFGNDERANPWYFAVERKQGGRENAGILLRMDAWRKGGAERAEINRGDIGPSSHRGCTADRTIDPGTNALSELADLLGTFSERPSKIRQDSRPFNVARYTASRPRVRDFSSRNEYHPRAESFASAKLEIIRHVHESPSHLAPEQARAPFYGVAVKLRRNGSDPLSASTVSILFLVRSLAAAARRGYTTENRDYNWAGCAYPLRDSFLRKT